MRFADSKQRFSSRVADYVRYRPGYPPLLVALLARECDLRVEHVIADVGSGTGLLSKLFLANGNRVMGVEPNAGMRAAGDEFLAEYGNYSSVDFVVAGQAFHWFEPVATRQEFLRILQPGGWAAMVWNDRRTGETPFGRGYEDLLLRYGTDYSRVKDAYPEAQQMESFFGAGNFRKRELDNFQEFDFAGLAGRLRSSS